MDPADNPYLSLANIYDTHKVQHPERHGPDQEVSRLCYELFHVDERGRKLFEAWRDRYLMKAVFDPQAINARDLALWWEGFREAIRGMHNLGQQHIEYMNGVKNESRNNSASDTSTATNNTHNPSPF
jgi:hypothetical protein